jgi:Flp pilus assembly protein TadD
LEGIVDVVALTVPGSSKTVTSGYEVLARPGEALLHKRLEMTPLDAVQWTLFVPPLIAEADFPSERKDPELATKVRAAYEAVLNGALTAARGQLQELTLRYPRESAPPQILAVVLLSLNQNEKALTVATEAVRRAPDSAVAAIILSYVYQSLFDLEKAHKETRRALDLDPDNGLALTNLARLQFGADEVEATWMTLERANRVDPRNAEVYNLRGFVRLARNETLAAIGEFERASNLNRRLGEPHLGLGLAYMRLGQTEEAFRAISRAVLLAPQNSLFMSYWGKMLHQTNSFHKALEVLERAQKLDPRDPTPAFYKAVILRDLNRSGEAIRSFNEAIALNDNRAVYRSRFLLDRDLASRNINLAILYRQLGLNAWARNKAIAAIKQDFTNFNAHLFYAGALLELEGRSYSFNSQQLLARLLQPANVNTFNNFNNYTSFFEKPSVQGTLEGRAGNQDTYGGNAELFGSVPRNNLAFQLGGLYDRTDGWRDTNFDRLGSAVGVGKWQATPRDGIFLAASWNKEKQGDTLFPRFEVDSPSKPDDRSEFKVRRLEFGYHRHLSPASDLLIYLTHLSSDIDEFRNDRVEVTPGGTTIDAERLAEAERPFLQGQVHYTLKLDKHRLQLGSLQYRGDFDAQQATDFVLRGNGQTQRLPFRLVGNDEDIKFESYYVGDIWQAKEWLTVEAAAYYDRMRNANPFEGTDWTVQGFNPRLGSIIRPTDRDTLRFAAFRYILPFISPRLDPTDVSGIQIFRNTQEGSENTEVASSWEHEWKNGFASLDLFYLDKDYKQKLMLGGQETKRTLSGRTSGATVAINQLLTNRMGLSGAYRYLNVDDEVDSSPSPFRPELSRLDNVNRKDHLFQLAVRYQRPDGISAGIAQTYRYVESNNTRSNDSAAITDIDIRYEFPRKRGAAKLEIFNLFDNEFNWVTDQFTFEGRAPARQILLTLSLNY